ncbi:DEAD/DEAH box helicase [Vibrio splendidus]|uniref:DEAD/DEAH box helicase n=1 Tax=Vibrio splendidus TaxID=29497 RepID=UPI002469C400|nr:DEAD/DEAH box helicase [Vibrio splendidus]MDH5904632.1 DEAD/DEAH box helicase [Vibrio splendidus]
MSNRFGDFLAERVISDTYFNKLFLKLVESHTSRTIENQFYLSLEGNRLKDLFRFTYIICNSNRSKDRTLSYHIVALLEPFCKDNDEYKILYNTVLYKLGLFALDIDESKLNDDNFIELSVKKKINNIDGTQYVLTDAQNEIYRKMSQSSFFSFSGPTSLGKSFIIDRMVEKSVRNNRNIAIIVPSRALINQVTIEIRSSLKELIRKYEYSVLNTISGEEKVDKNYIFILTPERLLNLHTKENALELDDLFVDEAHKLTSSGSDSERSLTEYNAIEMTLAKYKNLKVYFSSPNISNPSVFLELFGKNPYYSYHTDEAPVAQNIFLINVAQKSLRVLANEEFINISSDLVNSIGSNDDFIISVGKYKHSNMVYCSRGETAVNYAKGFLEKLDDTDLSDEINNAIKAISDLVHEDYYLVKCLKKRVAYHHGKLPHSVRGIVEELFRKGEINYIFCTPTLAEGVNMPTKNIFIICENKIRYTQDKESNKIKSLNFWNLAGRAGRYRSELSGNVFCLSSDEKSWDNDLSIFKDKSVKLESTIEKSIKSKAKLKKLEQLLSSDKLSYQDVDSTIRYLANIICIDTLRFPEELHKSNTISLFIKSNLHKIVELAKIKSNDIKNIPLELLNSYKSLDFCTHKDIYEIARFHKKDAILPPFNYDSCTSVLGRFHSIYNWEETENIKKPQISYYNKLMYDWVSGKSVNQMIVRSIRYHRDKQRQLFIRQGKEVITPVFDGSLEHINILIEKLFIDLEDILRFKFERYFNHYYKALVSINGEDGSGTNWATFLEYGSTNPFEIELQNAGISRFTAINICRSEKLRKYVYKTNDELVIDYKMLLKALPANSFEYRELKAMSL